MPAATVQPLVASQTRQPFSKAAMFLASLSFGAADGELRGTRFRISFLSDAKSPQRRRWTWFEKRKSRITAIVRDALHNDPQPSPTRSGFLQFPVCVYMSCMPCRAGPDRLVTVEFFFSSDSLSIHRLKVRDRLGSVNKHSRCQLMSARSQQFPRSAMLSWPR